MFFLFKEFLGVELRLGLKVLDFSEVDTVPFKIFGREGEEG